MIFFLSSLLRWCQLRTSPLSYNRLLEVHDSSFIQSFMEEGTTHWTQFPAVFFCWTLASYNSVCRFRGLRGKFISTISIFEKSLCWHSHSIFLINLAKKRTPYGFHITCIFINIASNDGVRFMKNTLYCFHKKKWNRKNALNTNVSSSLFIEYGKCGDKKKMLSIFAVQETEIVQWLLNAWQKCHIHTLKSNKKNIIFSTTIWRWLILCFEGIRCRRQRQR